MKKLNLKKTEYFYSSCDLVFELFSICNSFQFSQKFQYSVSCATKRWPHSHCSNFQMFLVTPKLSRIAFFLSNVLARIIEIFFLKPSLIYYSIKIIIFQFIFYNLYKKIFPYLKNGTVH